MAVENVEYVAPITTNNFSETYSANAVVDGTPRKIVAKRYASPGKWGFSEEVTAAKSLSHPNIIEMLGFDEERAEVYLGQGFYSLKRILDHTPVLPILRTKRIALQVAEGLAYLHSESSDKPCFVHNDISAGNVIITHTGARISDFAVSFCPSDAPGYLTRTIAGTPYFMAPEKCSLEGNIGPESDVWAFGVLVYLMSHGKMPYREEDLYDQIVEGAVADPDSGDSGIDRAIEKCFQLDISDRPTAAELVEIFSDI